MMEQEIEMYNEEDLKIGIMPDVFYNIYTKHSIMSETFGDDNNLVVNNKTISFLLIKDVYFHRNLSGTVEALIPVLKKIKFNDCMFLNSAYLLVNKKKYKLLVALDAKDKTGKRSRIVFIYVKDYIIEYYERVDRKMKGIAIGLNKFYKTQFEFKFVPNYYCLNLHF